MIIYDFEYRKPSYLQGIDTNNIDTVVVHHTGNDNSIYTNTDYHMDDNAWSWIGYGYYIKDGKIFKCRGISNQNAAVRGHNHHTVNIAVQGNYDIKELSNADREALNFIIDKLISEYKSIKYVKVHSDLNNDTACAGKNINKYYSNNKYKVKVDNDLVSENYLLIEENKKLKLKIKELEEDIENRKSRNGELWERIILGKKKRG